MALLTVDILLAAGCASQVGRDQELQSLPGTLPSAAFPRGYKVDPYIAAARRLQAIGRNAASNQLMMWAEGWAITVGGSPRQALPAATTSRQWPPVAEASPPGKLSIEDDAKIYVLCRMLFVARPGSRFAPPFLGDPGFLGKAGPSQVLTNGLGSLYFPSWPLCPIEIVDGVPFLITDGYLRQGIIQADEVKNYVSYCVKNCDWSQIQFAPKTVEQKAAALENLLASPNFRADRDPRGRRDDRYVRELLRSEIE
jgi:hypothetical protein